MMIFLFMAIAWLLGLGLLAYLTLMLLLSLADRAKGGLRRVARLTIGVAAGSLIVLGVLYVVDWTSARLHGDDWQVIDSTYISFYRMSREDELHSAYLLMSRDYRAKHSSEDFRRSGFRLDYPLRPDRSIHLDGDTAWLRPHDVKDLFYYGPEYELVKEDGNWLFTGKCNQIMD